MEKSFNLFPEKENAGEKELKNYLMDNGYKICDVSNDPNYWYRDIDLLVGDNETSIEVKWDSRINNTGNLYVEVENTSSKDKEKSGWFKFCEADYLAYGDAVDKIFYVFDFPQFKSFVLKHRTEFREVYCKDYSRSGDIYHYSRGLLVPLAAVQHLCKTSLDVWEY